MPPKLRIIKGFNTESFKKYIDEWLKFLLIVTLLTISVDMRHPGSEPAIG